MNIDDFVTYLLTPSAQVLIIMGLAEIAKKIGLNKKYIPLLDLVLGLISGVAVYSISMEYEIVQGIMIGLAIGLSACGLFSGIKNLKEMYESDERN